MNNNNLFSYFDKFTYKDVVVKKLRAIAVRKDGYLKGLYDIIFGCLGEIFS